ncbi:MAG: DNA recombination protein RmuC [Treponema sp.]|nr:DNA recombination protein RmuC [Treponema sp.]
MDYSLIFQIIIFFVVVIQIILLIFFRAKQKSGSEEHVLQKFAEYEKRLDKSEQILREEIGRSRDESNRSAKDTREELSSTLRANREELLKYLRVSLKEFEEKFSARIDSLTRETGNVFEKNRETIEKKLSEIQENNSKKLEEMRKTVDEKLHDTLEKRLSESFKQVRENLDKVLLGLGEMQSLANGVGDLKKVLSNVKTKGVLGEYQLAAILEQVLAPAQYAENVKTKAGSKENVEFAVKIPSKEDSNKHIWLPIDSKFPTADYENLLSAYDTADMPAIERAKKDLEARIKKSAKDIHEKYIEPPNTTDFAIMFLPFEGLYAEVLRIPSLFESIQAEYKIAITGPTTISAFLNSLQMGFRTLAVEKRTSEIWDLLGAVKTQFGKFADVLEAAKRKIDSASEELAKTGSRSRQIEKRLKDVQSLPEPDSQKLLGNLDIEDTEDEEP